MATLKQIRDKADAKLADWWPGFVAKQEVYRAKHDTYFGFNWTPVLNVINGADTDFGELQRPSRKHHASDIVFPTSEKMPYQMQVIRHHGKDHGYTATVRVHLLNGDSYTRSRNNLNKDTGWSKVIDELVKSGFIAYIPAFGKKKTGGKYRLIDEYSLFYLAWTVDVSKTVLEGKDKDYWIKKRTTRAWTAWSGYAFEGICLKHIAKIKAALGLSGISTEESGWTHIPKNKNERGSQIDLIIDRADRSVNLCEIKYSNSEFTIDKDYAKKLERKKLIFREKTGTKKTLFTTMITTYGTKTNKYYNSIVDNQLTMDDLF